MTTQHHAGTAYRITGDPTQQPLLVLIHGVGLEQGMWREWLELLSDDFAILTYDLLGHGASNNPPSVRKISDYTAQLFTLVEHLRAQKFALVGFSMGALIAQAFAVQTRNRLSHLALLHSVYDRSEAECKGVRERYEITRQHGAMSVLEMAIERWFSPDYRRNNPEKINQIRTTFAAHKHDGYLKAYKLFAHAEPEMKTYPPKKITCPTLVLTGEADIGSTAKMSTALHQATPNSQLIINPKHKHMAPTEHAKKITTQLRKFLCSN